MCKLAKRGTCGIRAFLGKLAVYAGSSDFARNAGPIGFVERCKSRLPAHAIGSPLAAERAARPAAV
jgi:hypothetical protein